MNRKRTFPLRPMSTRSNHIDFSPYWGNYTSSSFNSDNHKVSDASLCWIIGFDLQSDLASSQTIAMMLRSLFVICPKPHAHKNCYKSNRTIFFKVESPIFHLGDTQAWCKSWCKFLLIHRPGTNPGANSCWCTGLVQMIVNVLSLQQIWSFGFGAFFVHKENLSHLRSPIPISTKRKPQINLWWELGEKRSPLIIIHAQFLLEWQCRQNVFKTDLTKNCSWNDEYPFYGQFNFDFFAQNFKEI